MQENDQLQNESSNSAPSTLHEGKKTLTRKQYIIKETISIILIVLGVFAFRSSFFEPFRIPTGSMIPTLLIGDFIVVDKTSYGLKVPFSDMVVPFINRSLDPIYLTDFKMPERGDVVVFKYPLEPSLSYIKRLIGLPGDRIELIDDVVYVNGVKTEAEAFMPAAVVDDMDERYKDYSLDFFKTKTGNAVHIAQTERFINKYRTIPEFVVPDGYFFVMGDNRDFSADSRIWGFVPQANLRGKARFIWFSMRFPWDEGGFKLRLHRVGHVINWWPEDGK